MRKSTIENLKTCQPREQNMQLSFDKRCSFPAQNSAFSLGQTRLMSGKLSRLKSKHTRKNRHASGLNVNGSIILRYFHIQTSAIKRKYPTLIVRIFLGSARTYSISRYIHIQTLNVHKRNVLRFLQHGTYHVVVRGGLHFCQSPIGGGSGVFY